ncbi:hypothetical protein Tco_0090846 [Tanacetum coccineum]
MITPPALTKDSSDPLRIFIRTYTLPLQLSHHFYLSDGVTTEQVIHQIHLPSLPMVRLSLEITDSIQRTPSYLVVGFDSFTWTEPIPNGHCPSEASSDFLSVCTSSDSSSRHPLSDHSSPDLPSTSAGPSRKRRRSPMTYVPALSLRLILRGDLFEGTDAIGEGWRLLTEMAQTRAGVRGTGLRSELRGYASCEDRVIALTERIAELERDKRRLRGTVSAESQRVDRLQSGSLTYAEEFKQMRRLRFYDRVRVGKLEACARKHMGYRP